MNSLEFSEKVLPDVDATTKAVLFAGTNNLPRLVVVALGVAPTAISYSCAKLKPPPLQITARVEDAFTGRETTVEVPGAKRRFSLMVVTPFHSCGEVSTDTAPSDDIRDTTAS